MSCNDFVNKYDLANLLALFCFDCRNRAVLIQARAIKHSYTANSASHEWYFSPSYILSSNVLLHYE